MYWALGRQKKKEEDWQKILAQGQSSPKRHTLKKITKIRLSEGFHHSATLEKPLLFISALVQAALKLSTFQSPAKYLGIAEKYKKCTNKTTLLNWYILVLCYYQK